MKNESSVYLLSFSGSPSTDFTLGELPNLEPAVKEDTKPYILKIFNVANIEHYYDVENYLFSKLYYRKHNIKNSIEFHIDEIPAIIPTELHEGIRSLNSFYYKNKKIPVKTIVGKNLEDKNQEDSKVEKKSKKLNKKSHAKANISYNSGIESGRIVEDKEITVKPIMLSFSSVMQELERIGKSELKPTRYVTEISRPVFYKDAIDIEYLNGGKLKSDTFMFYLVETAIQQDFNYFLTNDDKSLQELVGYIGAVFCFLNNGIEVPDEKTYWGWCLWVLKNYAFRSQEFYKGKTLNKLQRRIRRQILDKYSWEEILKRAASQEWNFIREKTMRFPKGMSVEEKSRVKKEIKREPTKGERTIIENIKKIVLRRKNYKDESERELSEALGISKSSIHRALLIINSNKINYNNYKNKIKEIYSNLIE